MYGVAYTTLTSIGFPDNSVLTVRLPALKNPSKLEGFIIILIGLTQFIFLDLSV